MGRGEQGLSEWDRDGQQADQLAAFAARIQRREKIEATDWMPDEYRKGALRLIEMHAHSELMGALPEREWVPKAPTLQRKLSLLAKVQDEVGHAQLIYRVAEDLGEPWGRGRDEMLADLVAGKARFHNVFSYPAPTWADVAVIGWLVDGAAVLTQGALVHTSYAPYARILVRICAEEAFHIKHGEDLVLTLASGSRQQRAMLQDALNRWWQPLMHFFGPPDDQSKNAGMMIRWGLRTKTNEEMRQDFLTRYVGPIRALGLSIPDPVLHCDAATSRWVYSDPDWAEFARIIAGGGIKTAERLHLRRLTLEETQWVRDVLKRPIHSVA